MNTCENNGAEFGPFGPDAVVRLLEEFATGSEEEENDRDKLVIGEYIVDGIVGKGACGTVHKAVRRGSEREVALKLLHRPLNDERIAKRAWRELDVLEQLHLPCVPHVYDYGLHDGRLYFVTDLVAGMPLDEYCDVHEFGTTDRVKMLVRVSRAVDELHSHGFIHRDLKPGNVLLDEHGEPIIIDFGIASPMDEHALETMTVDGTPMGSLAFMPPEQARGDFDAVSRRSDVWALGAIGFWVLTGATPHDTDGSFADVLQRAAHEHPRDPRKLNPHLPRPLAAILHTATAPEPKDRYATAVDLAADLERWLGGYPVHAQSRSWIRACLLSMKRRPRRWTLGTAIASIIILLSAFSIQSAIESARMKAVEGEMLQGARRLRNAGDEPAWQDRLKMIQFLEEMQKSGYAHPDGEIAEAVQQSRNELATELLEAVYGQADEATMQRLTNFLAEKNDRERSED